GATVWSSRRPDRRAKDLRALADNLFEVFGSPVWLFRHDSLLTPRRGNWSGLGPMLLSPSIRRCGLRYGGLTGQRPCAAHGVCLTLLKAQAGLDENLDRAVILRTHLFAPCSLGLFSQSRGQLERSRPPKLHPKPQGVCPQDEEREDHGPPRNPSRPRAL